MSEFLPSIKDITIALIITIIVAICQGVYSRIKKKPAFNIPGWIVAITLCYTVCLTIFVVKIFFFESNEVNTITNKSFGVEKVSLDGNDFVNCQFDGTELLYKGEHKFGLQNCHMNSIRLLFAGHAGNTVTTLKDLYKDPAFKPLVEIMFQNIKSDSIKIINP